MHSIEMFAQAFAVRLGNLWQVILSAGLLSFHILEFCLWNFWVSY